jgi:hypothetical protein
MQTYFIKNSHGSVLSCCKTWSIQP